MRERELILVSHNLCPYVQRAVIVLTEKNIPHERRYIDLNDKPEWFIELSPTGRVPLLWVDRQAVLFESAVICEYLDEITPGSLHPASPLKRAQERAWMEFGSQILNDIAKLYNAREERDHMECCRTIAHKWRRLEQEIQQPFFGGERFGLVDATFGPIFRYFDVMDVYLACDVFEHCYQVQEWRAKLAQRPSVLHAVDRGYEERLLQFLLKRNSHISRVIEKSCLSAS